MQQANCFGNIAAQLVVGLKMRSNKKVLGTLAAGLILFQADSALSVEAPNDPTFDELTYVNAEFSECDESFDGGFFRFGWAWQASSATPVMLIKARTPKERLRVGERLYATGHGSVEYRALVIDASDREATIVLGRNFAASLFLDDIDSVWLSPRRDSSIYDRRFMTLDADHGQIRTALARGLDCIDQAEAAD